MVKHEDLPECVSACIGVVSAALAREIEGVVRSSRSGIEEIRLRASGTNSVRLFGRDYPLITRITREEIERIFLILSGSSLYAHRDSICDGYITYKGGVRVGVIGRAGYDGGRCVGIGDVTSLVFRIPSGSCAFAQELYERWVSEGEGGMLIVSPPGGGKTTALRSLAGYIGRQRRTLIADERCEFDPSEYYGTSVDVLRGYKRSSGIEIAARTMSAEIIICDEIFTDEDSEALIGALGAGVTVVATAHGCDAIGVGKRRCIRTLLDAGMFSSVVSVVRREGSFSYVYEKIG